ncbi:MAG: hypothetical protein AAF386_01730 [Pseudomonadota bacterium]
MSVGTYISVLGHAGLIGWVLVGDPFPLDDPQPMVQTTEVAVISADVFDIMMNNTQPDVGLVDDAQPPELTFEVPDIASETDPAPTQADVSETDPPDQDILPTERPRQLARPDPAALESPLVPTAPPVEVTPSKPTEVSVRPELRPSDRVAPQAVAPPPPDLNIGDITRDASEPAQEPVEDPVESEPAQAPEAASTEIVTEAEAEPDPTPDASPLAVAASLRPVLRPRDLPRQTQEPEPEPEPEAPTVADVPDELAVDPVTAALQQALADAETQRAADAAAAAARQAQSLSVAESQGLTLAIGECWNAGSLSTQALDITVVVDVEFTPDGRPIRDSIRMYGFQGGDRQSADRAFETAKRAILECGQTGYELPRNIYDVWKFMRLDFNPEQMRIK